MTPPERAGDVPPWPEVGDEDVANATNIFAIGCTLPAKALRSGKAADWSDVPDDHEDAPWAMRSFDT